MRRLAFGLATLALCGFAASSIAQQTPPGLPTPRIANAFPAGLKSGTSVEVTVVGTDLDEPTGMLFSHPGLKGEYLPPKPPEPDPKKKDAKPPAPKLTPNGPYKFKVSAEANVPSGTYDVRFVGKWGVSNPRAIAVGDRPEVNEKEPNNDVPEAQKVEVGTTINGVFTNGTDVDYTLFTGTKGQRIIIGCRTTSIDSKARPMIEVFAAADGRKLAINRNYKDGDAVTDVVLPADGDYLVRLFEFTYQQGSADHFYRLTISTAPWIDAVFPTAIEPGKPTQVTLYGRNLPGGTPADGLTIDGRPMEKLAVTVTPPSDPAAATKLAIRDRIEPLAALQDGFEYRIKGPGGESNAVPIYFAREKVVVKKNAGGTKAESPEPIAAPCEVVGMIHRKGDRDWYAFDAKKGDTLTIDVTAERNGGAADFFFNVYNPANKMQDLSGELDDENDQTSSLHPFGFYTRSGDPPPYRFAAPADGKFLVAVGCRESTVLTGPQTAYRLRVGPAKPDFRAVVMPYSRYFQTGSAGRQNSDQAYDVFVHRIDGFNGPVTVTVDGLPNGVTARPLTVGPTARWGVLNLDIADNAAAFTGPIQVKCSAAINGKPANRDARPATVTWGTPQPNQNVPVVARLDQSLALAVRPEKGFFKLSADTTNATIKVNGKDEKLKGPLVVKQGEKVTIPMKAAWSSPDKQNITVAAEPMMQGQQQAPITVQVTTQPTKDKPEGVIVLDVKANAFPGKYSISVRGDSQVPFVRDPMTKKGGNLPMTAFADPIEITVLPSSVAKVNPVQVPNVKLGQSVDVVVKVERQYDYAGEYKVAFAPPKDASGVSAAEAKIPAGADEVKLTIKAAADAKPGAVNNAVITVTAMYDGKPIAHEVKVTFAVAK